MLRSIIKHFKNRFKANMVVMVVESQLEII